MPAGRPRKPVALKKLDGTYRKDRDAPAESAESALSERPGVLLPDGAKIACPKTLRTKYVRAYWKKLVGMLASMRVLSAADIPQLEQLCVILEKLRELQDVFLRTDPLAEGYDRIQRNYIALSNKFDALGSKYYISPAARSRLVLDNLAIKKTEQDIRRAEDDAVSSLLSARR